METDSERLHRAEELLRLMASRLTLAAEGRDPQIDDAARALRKKMRNGLDYDAARDLLDRISTRMLTLDDPQAPSPPAADCSALAALLLEVHWPDGCTGEARSLLERSTQPGTDLHELTGAIAEFIRHCLTKEPALTPTLVDSVFNAFLQHADLGAELSTRAERIRTEAANADTPDAPQEALHALADLVAERVSTLKRQRRDLERFLGGVSTRLGDVATQLEKFASTNSSSREDARELGANMREQVEGLSSSMFSADSLEQIKLSVGGHLDKLLKRVNDYCAREEARSRELEQQVEKLSGRLQALESEGHELRTLLTAEHEAATTDALTGVPNRSAYDLRLKQEFRRWKDTGGMLSLVVLDVDHFKRVNDRYGHRAGDKALCMLARVLRGKVRDSDFFARYGGEEFVLVLPGTEREAALSVAEKLRQEARAAPFHHRSERVELTLSAGIAMFGEGDDPDTVFERADRALYRAKQTGRDRCEMAD